MGKVHTTWSCFGESAQEWVPRAAGKRFQLDKVQAEPEVLARLC